MTGAPASIAPRVIDTVSSVSPEYDSANASVPGPTNAGVRICFSTETGTGSTPLATVATTSPAIPEPPMPSSTMFCTASAVGSSTWSATSPAASCAAASCSGSPATVSRNPNESTIPLSTLRVGPLGPAPLLERPQPSDSAAALRHVRIIPAGATESLPGEGGLDAGARGRGHEPLVLRVAHGLGLVDEHDRDVVADRVAPLQPGVVERLLVGEVEQRALVLGTGQDLHELRVERHDVSFSPRLGSRPRSGLGADEGEHLFGVSIARDGVRRLDVQPQQRLGVAGSQVEPPVARVDGQAVEPVLVTVGERLGHTLDHRGRVADAGVDLARLRVALERLAQLRERLVGAAQHLEHDHRGDDPGIRAPVVAEVVVAGVLTAEHSTRVGHDLLDERVPDPGPLRGAAHLADHLGDGLGADEVVDDGL